jgi:hypothetical protein
VAPGESAALTFTFAPRAQQQQAAAAQNVGGLVLKRPGEWQEVRAEVVLRGGTIVPGASPERTVFVTLRGFVPGSDDE